MKKRCTVLLLLITLLLTACAAGTAGGTAGENDGQTVPMDAHQKLLGMYADYYGGSYVEDGKHYLLVTCDPDSMGDVSASIRGQGYVLQKVTYSYAELKAVCEDMNQRFASGEVPEELRQAVTSWGIHQKNNCISISVVSENNIGDAILEFLSCDPKMIEIEYMQRKPEAL